MNKLLIQANGAQLGVERSWCIFGCKMMNSDILLKGASQGMMTIDA